MENLTPPPELVQQWVTEAHSKDAPPGTCPNTRIIINRSVEWAAEAELDACCEWLTLTQGQWELAANLRTARRPKPPSLADEAMEALELCAAREHYVSHLEYWAPIVRAIKRLQELEDSND